MEENELDKSEQATPSKLKRAREKGTVARGIDLGFFAVISAFVAYAGIAGQAAIFEISQASGMTFRNLASADDGLHMLLQHMAVLFGSVFRPMLWMGVTIFSIVLLIEFLQVGPVFTFQTLKPDFKRINPAEGFKRLFSWRMLIEAFKSVIKLFIYGVIAWLVVSAALESDAVAAVDGRAIATALAALGFKLLLLFAIAALFIAAIDQIFARREFAKKMRMSRRELKREHRDREGDPRLKQKRRELHDTFVKMAQSLRGARDADVILTNPIHYAIALRYEAETMEAPKIVSRGSGDLAARIRQIGFVYGVVVIEDAPLARSLFRSGILDGDIPDGLYHEVADIYRKHRLLDRKKNRIVTQ